MARRKEVVRWVWVSPRASFCAWSYRTHADLKQCLYIIFVNIDWYIENVLHYLTDYSVLLLDLYEQNHTWTIGKQIILGNIVLIKKSLDDFNLTVIILLFMLY